MNKNNILVGVSGPFGSGKSTITAMVASRYADVTRIKMDNYLHQVDVDQTAAKEKGLQSMYDFGRLRQDLLTLKNDRPIAAPIFEPVTYERGSRVVHPTSIVLVEGSFLFVEPSVRNLFDLRVYIHLADEFIFQRNRQKWSKDSEKYYVNHILGLFRMFGSDQENFADVVISSSDPVEVVSKNLEEFLRQRTNIAPPEEMAA
ncbi:MAG: hypothetical protein AAGG02_19025 [Cyanobacteria bacterium P01_H01_bin.15]